MNRLASAVFLFLATELLPSGVALAADVAPVPLSWLGGSPPASPSGVSWGVPWPRGALAKGSPLTVRTADGRSIATQDWPLAFWPDGSVKWSGLAITANAHLAAPLTVAVGATTAPESPLRVQEDANGFELSTGTLRCRVARTGSNLIESLAVDGREVGCNGRLIAIREDRSAFESKGLLRQENYTSRVSKVTVEQAGPVRAVVRIEGMHAGGEPARAWLPFTLRLYFTAGCNAIRVVHSFVFDGDAQTDFIRGLGMAFTVPFREELQNRHVRFSGDGPGVWGEPVLMSPGYREVLVKNAVQMNRDQLEGKRIPNLDQLGPTVKSQFETIAVWDAFKLAQLAPDSFSLDKRTGAASSWLHIGNGRRARGFTFLGDVSGGLAVGGKSFWEKYPAGLEISGASTSAGELRIWFWSPDAPAMDLRHYDTIGHDGKISYEDYQEGFSTPYGVANTHELTLWALADTPTNATLAAMTKTAGEPPLLVCAPEYYHATKTLGVWSLPDRSTRDKAAMEEALDRAWRFYHREVEQRRWFGFWDFGDFMRTYDPRRHTWMYDIGGHAWNATELVPDLWLWFTFLRTGRADAFRFAEAMTRNTSEVDVYHQGQFFGLGSRHNVSHWGCGAKEARISQALLKRPYYYLTTDERTGDLMREVLTVDETIAKIQPLRHQLVRADEPIIFRISPDWQSVASNWMTEWERTGDVRYRDYVHAGMKSVGTMPGGIDLRLGFRFDLKTKQLFDIGEPNMKGGGFLFLFGGDQLAMDLMQLIDCPEFAHAWNQLCEKSTPSGNYNGARIAAYVAKLKNDPALGHKVWQELRNSLKTKSGRERFPANPDVFDDSRGLSPVEEILDLDTPGTAQWALNIITATELAREFYVPPASPN